MKARACIVALSLCWLGSATARARPSLWDLARDPAIGHADAVMRRGLSARMPGDIPPQYRHVFEQPLSLQAATVLELSGAARLPSSELRVFLGETLIAAGDGREADGREILLQELSRGLDPASAADAWFRVAIASNRLRDFATEKAAYDRALELEWDPGQRARILMNRGETKMTLGELPAARADYLRALSTSDDSEVFALAHFGLAVSLARDNELPEALEHASLAASLKFPVDGREALALDLPSVFYTPEYEIHYYRALAFLAEAEKARPREKGAPALEQARTLFFSYLEQARPAKDRWIENVERHVAYCERRLARLKQLKQRPSTGRVRRARSE